MSEPLFLAKIAPADILLKNRLYALLGKTFRLCPNPPFIYKDTPAADTIFKYLDTPLAFLFFS